MSEAMTAPAPADNAAPATPPADAAPSTPPAADWRAALPEDVRAAPSMQKFKDPAELAKSYLEAEKLIGRKGVIVPGEGATPEEVAAYRAAIGVPEAPDAYGLAAPEGLPEGVWNEESAKVYAAKAHELGLTGAQAKGLAEWFAKSQAEAMGAAEPWEPKLKQEWGAQFQDNLALAQRAARQFGADEATLAKLAGAAGDAGVMRMFHKIGAALGEDKPAGMNSTPSILTPERAKAEADAIINEKGGAYQNALHPQHKQTVQRVVQLMKVAFPS